MKTIEPVIVLTTPAMEVFLLVQCFFNDMTNSINWLTERHETFKDKPIDMINSGRLARVRKYVETALEENWTLM